MFKIVPIKGYVEPTYFLYVNGNMCGVYTYFGDAWKAAMREIFKQS